MRFRSTLLAVILLAAFHPLAHSQDTARKTTPLPVAAEQITERSITSTLSFLASDELAGRGTGTPEFDIAAAYVASRFRGAGLEPGGDDGSFYHMTSFPLKYLPSAQEVQTGTDSFAVLGVLGASNRPISYAGELQSLDLETPDAWGPLSRFIVSDWETTAKGQRALSQLARIAQQLEAAGAKGLILKSKPDSEWLSLATQLEGSARFEPRNEINIPILIVASDAKIPTTANLSVPAAQIVQHPMRNVIGMIPGSDPELGREAVIFSAHLDHLGKANLPGDNIYNGADDNASGVTSVLELADAFAAMETPPKRTLLFVTFWGEEAGLLGSAAYANRPSWPLKSIVANVNIEMIGRPEDGARGKTWVTGWSESDLGPLMRASAAKYGFEIFEHPQFSAMLYRSSDNWSFVERGVIAHSFSGGSLHNDYHQVTDEWDRLQIQHMKLVTQGLFAGSLSLVQGEVTPQKSR